MFLNRLLDAPDSKRFAALEPVQAAAFGCKRGSARRSLGVTLAAVLLASSLAMMTPSVAAAGMTDEDTTVGEKVLDVTVLRPIGAVRLLAGTALFVPMSFVNGFRELPLALLGLMGVSDGADWTVFEDSAEVFIKEPYRYMLTRPLGQDLAG